jgi:hypothetical protein
MLSYCQIMHLALNFELQLPSGVKSSMRVNQWMASGEQFFYQVLLYAATAIHCIHLLCSSSIRYCYTLLQLYTAYTYCAILLSDRVYRVWEGLSQLHHHHVLAASDTHGDTAGHHPADTVLERGRAGEWAPSVASADSAVDPYIA